MYCTVSNYTMATKLTRLFKSKSVGNLAVNDKIPKNSLLGCLLARWGNLQDDLQKSQMTEYCNNLSIVIIGGLCIYWMIRKSGPRTGH